MTDSSSSMADIESSYVDPMCAEIIVVRHGETKWNADGRIQGHLDVELNEVGKQQAASVADRLSKEPKISAVYSSDLKRALVTAEIIAASCGGLEVIKDPDLRERHLGDLQGLVYREAAKLSPKVYQAFSSHKKDQDIPGGGESLDQLYQRCTSSLQRIARKHKGERVVVATHGGVIRALYKRACPNGRSVGKVLNASVNIFHLFDGDKWTIKTWGDVSHLKQTGYLNSGFGGSATSG
ncbi:phosphoglycerate mutase-like protein 4 isoform X3 [Tripterygium wilfordii]|uniref:phosphoglycerate mutase-like protein 4 isoform X3 n=1 Tax=Tripterygium wilfordii TaxID=458696 RepID=UPI0018F84D7B|nr:phosphoglycerate mutase-like protein 4 isoform X3 [Tripterygium wilfordii]